MPGISAKNIDHPCSLGTTTFCYTRNAALQNIEWQGNIYILTLILSLKREVLENQSEGK